MAKKMTLRERAERWAHNTPYVMTPAVRPAVDGYMVGHRAGSRLTKAERKVIEAAVEHVPWAETQDPENLATYKRLQETVAAYKKVRK
jgi:hypothetical protein